MHHLLLVRGRRPKKQDSSLINAHCKLMHIADTKSHAAPETVYGLMLVLGQVFPSGLRQAATIHLLGI